jgi:3-hydroxyisobutyrate dehydrogenase
MTAEQGSSLPGTVVGFVGLGNMGIPMTKRLVAAGYQVRGFDTSAAALRAFAALQPGSAAIQPGSKAQKASIEGSESANEPEKAGNEPRRARDAGKAGGVTTVCELGSVGDGADAVILMLPDSDIVERVVLGRLASEAQPATGATGSGTLTSPAPEATGNGTLASTAPGSTGGGPLASTAPGGMGGLLDSLAPGTTIIDMSSSDPVRTRVLAEIVASAGMTLIDAPVSGGVSGARAGTLMIMVGGPAEAFERFEPMLGAIGKRVVHAGEIGAGHAVKALNNLMSAAHLLASSEALIAGRRFGLDPAVMLEIINGASGRSGSTENKWPNYILTEKYDAGFPMRLMVKDLKLALSIEHATGVPSAASETVVATWEAALADLPPDSDHTAIARWLANHAEEQ